MRNVWHTQAIYLDVVDPWWMPVEIVWSWKLLDPKVLPKSLRPKPLYCIKFEEALSVLFQSFYPSWPHLSLQALPNVCWEVEKVGSKASGHPTFWGGVTIDFSELAPASSSEFATDSSSALLALGSWIALGDPILLDNIHGSWFTFHGSSFYHILSTLFCIVNIIQRHCWAICVDLCRPYYLPLLLCRWWESLPLPILSRNLWDKGCTLEKNVGHRSQVL